MMPPTKLYTEEEIKSAMIVGIGLGGIEQEEDAHAKIDQAMGIFTRGHGLAVANYDTFKRLQEERDWRGLAEAHIAAAHMEGAPHELLAVACVVRELLDEIGHLGGVVDSLDSALRAR